MIGGDVMHYGGRTLSHLLDHAFALREFSRQKIDDVGFGCQANSLKRRRAELSPCAREVRIVPGVDVSMTLTPTLACSERESSLTHLIGVRFGTAVACNRYARIRRRCPICSRRSQSQSSIPECMKSSRPTSELHRNLDL